MKKKIKKILQNSLITTKGLFHCFVDDNKLNQLLEEFRKIIGKNKVTAKDEGFDAADHDTPIEVEAFNEGYNQRGAEILERIDEK